MSHQSATIEHPGIVTRIEGDKIEVTVLAQSACSSCNSKSACGMSEMEHKTLWAEKKDQTEYTVGQNVTVYMKQQSGSLAVILGYILPFVLVLAVLIAFTASGFSEGIAGISALIILIPYYLLVYFLRQKISKRFAFYIK